MRAGDQQLAHAAALMHVNTSESWLRAMLAQPASTTRQPDPNDFDDLPF